MTSIFPSPLDNPHSVDGDKAHHQRGFSLIEIMVVILIVGIILSFVVLAFGDFGASRRARLSTQHLASLIKLSYQKAIIGDDTFGLDIKTSGYRFYQFQSTPDTPYGKWVLLSHSHIFKPTRFPPDTRIKLSIKHTEKGPDIIMTSAGQITPFVFTLISGDEHFRIESTGNGQIKMDDQ
jgi:general secretion pathway protein H